MSDKKVEHLSLFELLERNDLFDLGLPEEESTEYQKFIRSIETAKKQAANDAGHNDNVNNYVLFRTIFYDDERRRGRLGLTSKMADGVFMAVWIATVTQHFESK